MRCPDCGREMEYVSGAFLCPECDALDDDVMNKTIEEDTWIQGESDVESDR